MKLYKKVAIAPLLSCVFVNLYIMYDTSINPGCVLTALLCIAVIIFILFGDGQCN